MEPKQVKNGAVGKAVGWLFKIVKMVVSLRRKS